MGHARTHQESDLLSDLDELLADVGDGRRREDRPRQRSRAIRANPVHGNLQTRQGDERVGTSGCGRECDHALAPYRVVSDPEIRQGRGQSRRGSRLCSPREPRRDGSRALRAHEIPSDVQRAQDAPRRR